MKKRTLQLELAKTFFVFLFLAAGAFAHIGDVLEQCAVRYGQPIEVNNTGASYSTSTFNKDGYTIFVTFLNGKAGNLKFIKSPLDAGGFGSKISDNEIEFIIKSTSPQEMRKQLELAMGVTYSSSNGQITAQYDAIGHSLSIFTKEFHDGKHTN